ncbi:LppP/LprE family lipoprotein [Streptomyces viridosporus]|uniref:LppP/LprE family lipoprotein n=1 Tax=Streptomyces viridosporus TaxID=67581 RepID=UPI00341DCCCD
MAGWASVRWGRAGIFIAVASLIGGGVALEEGWLPWQSEGRLRVDVDSLPNGKKADVTVRGPDGITEHVTRSSTITGLRPGRYTVTAGPVQGTDHNLYPPRVEQTVTVPADGTASATIDYNTVIPHATKPVNASDVRQVDGEVVTLSEASPVAQNLAVGDILVVGVSPKTPEGLLRKVVQVRGRGNEVIVVTKPATLVEAVPQGRIDVTDVPLQSPGQSAGAENGATRPAVYSRARNGTTGPLTPVGALEEDPELEVGGEGGFAFGYKVDLGKTDFGADKSDPNKGTLNAECAAVGAAPLLSEAAFAATTPRFSLVTRWDNGRQKGVRWSLKATQTSTLGAETNSVEAKCDARWLYPKEPVRVGRFTVPVGPLQVVVSVEAALTGVVGVAGKASVKVDQKASFEAGMELPKTGPAKPIAKFENKFTVGDPVALEGELSAKAGVRLTFLLYGTAGPYLDLTPGVKGVQKVNVERQGTISTELRGGLYTSAGIDMNWIGLDQHVAEIPDLFHIDKVIWDKTWRESPTDKAARENPTACPDTATTTSAVVGLDEVADATDMMVTGRKCWRDWAVVDWVPNFYADRVSATVFKRKGNTLTPQITMVGTDGPKVSGDHTATCRKVEELKVPPGLLDYLCPTSTGPSATAPFDPAAANVFKSGGFVPFFADASDMKALKGPLRAVQACGNCGPEGGDGSAQIIMLFYGNRYVGMVEEGEVYSSRQVISQDGTRVTSRVQWATPDDPVCCPSGKVVTYRHTWRDHQLYYTESVNSGQ